MTARVNVFLAVVLLGWAAVYVLASLARIELLANAAAVLILLTAAAALFGAGAASFYRQACAENGDTDR